MENLQQQFLKDSVFNLENLCSKLASEPPTEEFLREVFRFFHNLKGTSQTLNYRVAGKIAHQLEDLLQAAKDKKIPTNKYFVSLLREGAEILCENFRRLRENREISAPNDFSKKLRSLLPDYPESAADFLLDAIPPDVLKQLSIEEKKSLSTALANGNRFYSVEVGFDLADFTEKFRGLSDALRKQSKIIATFPYPALSADKRIGFRIFFASRKNKNKLIETVNSFDASLTLFDSPAELSINLPDVIARAVAAGERVARQFDKHIEFETATDKIEISDNRLKVIFNILLHLVRNAVDHAIATSGKIKIELRSQNGSLILRVSDDGRGLDKAKIQSRAVQMKLITADKILSRREIFDLIFAHGFSTRDGVSEISGRGVGLDVVKDAVENAKGTMRVASKSGKGTVFEISLPREFW